MTVANIPAMGNITLEDGRIEYAEYDDSFLVRITWLDSSEEVTIGRYIGIQDGFPTWMCPNASRFGGARKVVPIRKLGAG